VSGTVTAFEDYIAVAVPSAVDGTVCKDRDLVVGTPIENNSLPRGKVVGFENYIRCRGPHRFRWWDVKKVGTVVGVA
jgi:hypothetical protein